MTKTFSQFLSDVITRQARFSDSTSVYPMGTAFCDELYANDRALLANAFIVTNYDPFGKDDVSLEAIAFVERNW